MNAIQNALKDIHFTIPKEILHLTFFEKQSIINSVINIDESIMAKVIRPKVLVDCNLVGGIEMSVNFNHTMVKQIDYNNLIIEIPKTLTNNSSIITATALMSTGTYNTIPASISASNMAYSGFGNNVMSPVLDTGMRMMNALANLNIVQTSRMEVIGENTILVCDPTIFITTGVLKCNIENAVNLENINPRSYIAFANLATLAVKAYIYNKLKIELDKGYLYAGHELSVITDIVNDYADSYSLYLEELQRWKKIAFMNNNIAKARYIQSMLGSVV